MIITLMTTTMMMTMTTASTKLIMVMMVTMMMTKNIKNIGTDKQVSEQTKKQKHEEIYTQVASQ